MEQEARKLRLATPGERLLGHLLDAIVALAFLMAGIAVSTPEDRVPSTLGGLLCIAYVLFADGLPGPPTLGKRILGIAVVDEKTRKRCSIPQSFVRNIVRPIAPIDLLLILSEKHKRLGDILAGTIVVNVRAARDVKNLMAVHTVESNDEALRIHCLLEKRGIPSFVTEANLPIDPLVDADVMPTHHPQVWVPASEKDEVAELLTKLELRQSGSDIEVTCEDCGNLSRYPGTDTGTIQECHHCGTYLDVRG